MDKTALVDRDIEFGRWVLEALDQQGVNLDLAAWVQDDETGTWRLLVSSPDVTTCGSRHLYDRLLAILHQDHSADAGEKIGDIAVVGPGDRAVRDLKGRVGTDRGTYAIRLHNARVYRAVGDVIDNGARVRVKATDQLGTVRGVVDTQSGPRYLVLFDVNEDELRPQEGKPAPMVGRDFAAEDLNFLYVVRTGGWPERTPQWLLTATGATAGLYSDVSVSAPGDR